MTKTTNIALDGDAISVALDPHRRRSVSRALAKVLGKGADKTVALVGFQAMTFFEEVADLAKGVVLIEARRDLVERYQKAIVARELGKKVKLVEADPVEVVLEEPVDVAVYLPQSTWMMEGPDAAVLGNIAAGVMKSGGRLIPRRVVQLLELACPPTTLGGLSLRQPRYSRAGEPVATLSESKHFLTTDFGTITPGADAVDDTIIIRPLLGGMVSALRLSSLVELAEGIVQLSSEAGVKSIIVPLREDVVVRAGQPISIRVRYEPGEGLASANFSARLLAEGEDKSPIDSEHPVVKDLQKRVRAMVHELDKIGRVSDLDRVVSYTRRPHGDVSRLTALFWSVDEEFRQPLREIVEGFRRQASKEIGKMPSDESIYDWMLEVYDEERG